MYTFTIMVHIANVLILFLQDFNILLTFFLDYNWLTDSLASVGSEYF